jgi:hypothetical protein
VIYFTVLDEYIPGVNVRAKCIYQRRILAHHGTPTMFQNIDEVRDLIATHMNGTIDGCFITVDGLSAGRFLDGSNNPPHHTSVG